MFLFRFLLPSCISLPFLLPYHPYFLVCLSRSKMLATSWSVSASSESLSYFWWQMRPPPSLHWRGLSSDGRFLVGLSHLCPLSSEAREKKTWLFNAEFKDANMNLRFLNLHMNWQFNGIPLPSVTLKAFRKGFMGLCRITLASLLLAVNLFITLLPDRTTSPGFVLAPGRMLLSTPCLAWWRCVSLWLCSGVRLPPCGWMLHWHINRW